MDSGPKLRLLLGTYNAGKAVEISSLLSDLNIEFLTLRDFLQARVVEESGDTYEENAILKARGYARQTGILTLADDSGLEVDALGGAPGVLSARYAGAGASDGERIEQLLKEIRRIPGAARTARFVCVVAVADSAGKLMKVERGTCEGTITNIARGSNGFGYDPIFVPHGFDSTFAELPSETKDLISHRARALHAMQPFLARLISRNLTRGDANS
ncbi:MAG: hypothetical protein JWM21_168 [Acidobacteria bacterium]|nr:hypothetical protein [Acidobacteriota bacterium]